MEIVKEKYTLREWQLTDIESLVKNANNIHIWRNMTDLFPHPYTQQDAESFIHMNMGKNEQDAFAIVVNGQAVGNIWFDRGKDVERFGAEIGYWLGEAYWGQNILSDAMQTVRDYIFTKTDIVRLFARAFSYNSGSMRVLEKSGFTKFGMSHQSAIKEGRFVDMPYYELLKYPTLPK